MHRLEHLVHTLVFLLNELEQPVDHLLRHVVDVLAALGRRDRVDEAELLEAVVTGRDRHLPPIGDTLEDSGQGSGHRFGAEKQVDVVGETLDRELLAVQVHLKMEAINRTQGSDMRQSWVACRVAALALTRVTPARSYARRSKSAQ